MRLHGIRLTLFVAAFALAQLTPLFAQENPTDHQSSVRNVMAGLIREINTAEMTYYLQNHSYLPWKSLLESQQQKLNAWLAEFCPQYAKTGFGNLPDVLPGLRLRLTVAPDGRSYVVLVEDPNDKTGFAFLSDEGGVIRYCQYIQ